MLRLREWYLTCSGVAAQPECLRGKALHLVAWILDSMDLCCEGPRFIVLFKERRDRMSYQDPYAPQDVYAQQQQLGNYTQPEAYGQPAQPNYAQPGAYPPPPQPYSQPQPYPPPAQPYGQPLPYPPAQQNYVQSAMMGGNRLANWALYSGIISLVLALITFVAQIGAAGLITGAFAIFRGIMALNRASRVPGNPGRSKAIAGIALGVLAWVIVLASLALRGFSGS
jgi:hypothetical protein